MNLLTISNVSEFDQIEFLMKYCEVIAKAPAYAAMGGMPGVFALVMSARELGIGPMSALNGGMFLIPATVDKEGKLKGHPQIMMSARTMNMMILKAGHIIEEIENTQEKITLKGTRADNKVSMSVTYTLEQAKKAGLSHDIYGKPKLWSAWFKNLEDMIWKTCLSKLARRLFADVIGNAYEPSEFEEKENEDKKIEKKHIKGKNIAKIEKIEEIEEIEECEEQKESFEEFKNLNGLLDNSNTSMIKFIEEAADKRSISFEQMLEKCYINKNSFIKKYEEFNKTLQD